MSDEYAKPAITPIAFDFDTARLAPDQTAITLSRKDVLGIVQSAFEELGPASEKLIAVKREVLAEVADGRPAHALRTAIVGAARARCTCCR
ncbi:hypothetical protein [Erythrobacter oryzae]|uniref:hypothetical protein n=1 Tax=Erythrobacter oryzae TaxID=3019556 RepID=UPI0025560C49|nr:hypothetical protein [Erythrobacter sp. COR-2]